MALRGGGRRGGRPRRRDTKKPKHVKHQAVRRASKEPRTVAGVLTRSKP